MIIVVGTTNTVKIQAVEEVIKNYSPSDLCVIKAFAVDSGVSEQPLTLEEIIKGAKNRAENAYKLGPDCDYSIGLESGLFEAKGTKTGYLETSICSIYDGSNHFIGMSCGIEIPKYLLDLILEKKMDLNQACNAAGITNNKKLNVEEGVFGLLTKGRVNRKDYTKQGIMMAMTQIESKDLYQH